MTGEEKEVYVYGFICHPALLSSFPFSCLMTVIQSKLAVPSQKGLSPMYIHMLKRLLSQRANAIIEEITSAQHSTGVEQILQSEHNADVANALLHTPDIICNALSSSPAFFLPSTFYRWLADKLLRVFLGFPEDRDASLYATLVARYCLLGLTRTLSASLYDLLLLLDRKKEPSREDRLLLLDRASILRSLRQFVGFLPELRFGEFVSEVLSLHFAAEPPVAPCISSHTQVRFALLHTLLFSSLSPTQAQRLASVIVRVEFPLAPLLSFLRSLYAVDTRSNAAYTSLLSYTVLSSLFTALASSSFAQHFASSHQLYLASLSFCCVHSSLLFLSFAPPNTNPLLTTLMQAISNRLGEGTEPFRQRIIGMAKEVAVLIQPESHYDWPTTDLSELVAICDRKEEETETPAEEASELPPVSCPDEERPKESLILGVDEKKPKQSSIMDMDEEIDVFAEEQAYLERAFFPETEDSSAIPENEAISEDEDDEFLPYDLTEPTTHVALNKEYHFLQEPLPDFADEDAAVRLHAWKSLQRLSVEQGEAATAEDVAAVLRVVLAFEEMQGDEAFWEEFQTLVATLLFLRSEAGMACVLEFVKKNGRSNLTVVKCAALLQAVQAAVRMLARGRLDAKEEQPPAAQPPVVLTGAVEEDGLLRVANTKYRPSFYRSKLEAQEKASEPQRAPGEPMNRFTENACFFLRPLVAWALRVPPRHEASIAFLLATLAVVCSGAVLAAEVDATYRDLCAVMLRYRFHRNVAIRRAVLELFLALTKYSGSLCVDAQCAEFQSRERVRAWMESIGYNDTDDICRAFASSILQQLKDWFLCCNKHNTSLPSTAPPSSDPPACTAPRSPRTSR